MLALQDSDFVRVCVSVCVCVFLRRNLPRPDMRLKDKPQFDGCLPFISLWNPLQRKDPYSERNERELVMLLQEDEVSNSAAKMLTRQ